jgi:peptide/nickel transport system substrate-binding protein
MRQPGENDEVKALRRKMTRRRFLQVLGGGTGAVLVARCAPAPQPTPSGTAVSGATATAVPATPTPAEEKSILILAEDIPGGLDWEGPSGALATSQTGMVNVYDTPLAYYFVESTTEPGVFVPDFTKAAACLVESWEVGEDNLTWTFHLRQGVKSYWGNELTADDVEWTLAKYKHVTCPIPVGWFMGNVASLFTAAPLAPDATEEDKALGDEFKKIDKYTFQLKQFEPNRLLPTIMANLCMGIYDSTEAKKHVTTDDPWACTQLNEVMPYGFGAYVMESWTKDVEFVARANPNYWGGKPAIDKVTYRKVPTSSSRYAAILTGDAQVVEHLTYKEFNDLVGKPGVKVTGVYGSETLYLQLNWKDPLWTNKDLRKAVAYAIPYEDIIRTAYYGNASQWKGCITSRCVSYHEKAFYSHDLDKAREALVTAGFPEGRGLEAYPDSLKMSYVVERASFLESIAAMIQTELAKVGIPITLDPIPNVQFSDRMSVKKDLPMGLNDVEHPHVPDAEFHTGLFFITPPAGINNMSNYSNARVDELYGQARGEPDFDARDALLDEIQTILMEDLAWVPIVERKTLVAMRDNLCCYYWYPDTSLRWKHFDYVT